MNWLEAQIQPELCSGLLQGSCLFFFLFFTFFCKVLVSFLASSVTYIRLSGILLLSHFFCDLHPFRDLVIFLASSVTYIRLGGILLFGHFWFLYLHPFRDLVILLALLVTYICLDGILLLSHFWAVFTLQDLLMLKYWLSSSFYCFQG